MKIKLLLITLFFSLLSQSQEKKDTILLDLAKENQINYISNSFQDLKDGILYRYQEDINILEKDVVEGSVIYNNTVLNEYFKNIISAYATNTGDLSFESYFANVNATAKTLTFGRSLRFDNFYFNKEKRTKNKTLKPIRKLGNLLTIYGKANYSNGFANLYSEQTLEDETKAFKLSSGLGIGFKFTHIFNGKITVTNENVKKIAAVRKSFVKETINSKIAAYEKNELPKEIAIANYDENDVYIKKTNKENLIKNKYFKFYKDIMLEELANAKAMNLIKSSHVTWFSLAAYVPITDINVKYSTDNVNFEEALYRDNSLTLTINYLYNRNKFGFLNDVSTKFTFEGSSFNTNTFIANNANAVKFQNIISDNGTTVVEGTANNVFIGAYKAFRAKSLKAEFVTLVLNNSVGLSAAIEQTFGLVENTNWKLGMPFSLKDKDGKPTINFELQWRELNSNHFVGIAVGYNFGRFIK